MKRRLNKYGGLLIVLMTGMLSCKVREQYTAPSTPSTALFRDVSSASTNNIADLHWKEVFTDTLLQQLITTGIANNPDLLTAYSRVRQSQAYLAQSRMAFLPSLNAGVTATLNNASDPAIAGNNAAVDRHELLTGASWEADIWGKLRSNKRASLAALLQSDANARAVMTGLIANIATYYYQLLALDKQLYYTRESVRNWQTTVNVMKELKKSDVVTGAAIVQSEASKYGIAATIPDLERSVRETENALNQLLGRAPAAIPRAEIAAEQPLALLSTGVPAQLLSNRPDVQAAEQQFRYYFELVNAARAYFYPSLTLSASAGYLTVDKLWSPGSWISSIVGGLTQPIIAQGANKTRLQVAREQQQQALINFQNVLLTSGREVSNALYAYQASVDKANVRDSQLVNLDKSVTYTQQLVRYGFANYTEVLTAQQSMLNAQLSQVNDRLQQLTAVVQLYKALGGGWK
ncbi:TolC family protein [Chitinophaga agri]|uniref:TolC family protein n=1 Tax=Chitinophaga agri TaxID=2703787 RepID=A0A6B9ZLU3_9BACT|nr:TolC family protein [Chitinophaga agri]QHS62887.1 TolC family protein [Chitinophaga agri]